MFISIVFSVAIYNASTREIQRIIHHIQDRQEYQGNGFFPPPPPLNGPSLQELENAKTRFKLALLFINGGIFVLAGASGYFLAGRTLKPIKVMVDEQKRFITDSSHELRTPLTALRSEIEVGLRDKNISLAEAKALLVSNLEEVVNLQALSDNLLLLSESRNTARNFQEVSLLKSIESAEKKIAPLAKQKKISIKTTITDARIVGDEISLCQLFVILLENAIKYSRPQTTITLGTEKTGKALAVYIHDEGIGIDKKDLPLIFERFYRADKSRSKSVNGYGLGLSIAKKIAEEHSGHIQVESKVGRGSTFTVRFPNAH